MCRICDGYTYDEVLRADDLIIRVHGWLLQHVEPGVGDCGGFGYTVGLLESYDHPELIAMDLDVDAQSALLRPIVEMIRTTGKLDHDALAAAGIDVVEVHPDHLHGDLFGSWCRRYGRPPSPGDVLQVIPPACWFCPEHAGRITRLDQPGGHTDPERSREPNRAERRQAARARRRHQR
jgi:hypothetical protein